GTLIPLLPLLVLAAVALFAFAGCGTPFESGPATPPNGGDGEQTYEEAVRKTAGLIAYWRLDETKLPADPYPPAKDSGGINTTLDGTYNGNVALSNVPGALVKTEPTDTGTTFDGSGYVEVPWNGLLDPP